MRIFKRVVLAVLGLLLLLTAGLTIAIVLREDRTFQAPYPALSATSDPTAIARGEYLVYGPAHCVNCHSAPGPITSGAPLSGGRTFELPIGTLHAPNLTPDPETGIGKIEDGALARALRYGVGHDGRALLPFMPFAEISDRDLVAVLSFLRAQPAVHNPVPKHRFNVLGRALKAFVLEPVGPAGPVPRDVAPGPTVEYGRYLANSVANCGGCHTNRDLATGKAIGEPFAGGFKLGEQTSRNLTPDPESGWIYRWSEEDFVSRFHNGTGMPGTHMPWAAFSHMTDDDVRAIYRYLRTLPPVRTAPLAATPAS